MIKDALEFIFGKADDAANPIASIRRLGPRTRVVTVGGEAAEEVIERPRLHRSAETLDSLAILVANYGESAAAYVDESGVSVVLVDDDRMETAEMRFVLSPQFETLLTLSAGVNQRQFVKILRTSLAGCIDHNDFLATVRNLTFETGNKGTGVIDHKRESLGRQIEKEVRANAGDLPEEVTVMLPMFSVPHDFPSNVELRCALTLDIDNERLMLDPTGDSLTRERKRVLSDLRGRLADLVGEGVTVVHGSCVIADLVE